MMYRIERNVPIPPKSQNGGRKRLYPFANMQVSDSIFVCGKNDGKKVMGSARAHGKAHGKRFIYRAEGDGVRIWRVE